MNKQFVINYKDSLKSADLSILFYNPSVVSQKKLENLDPDFLKSAFNDQELNIFTESNELQDFLLEQNFEETNLVIMSSGNFAFIDLNQLVKEIKSR